MKKALERLFEEWQKETEGTFVKDGVIDEKHYAHIVWLLRETNDFGGNLADLIKDCIENRANHKKYWKTPQTHYKKSVAVHALLHPEQSNEEIKKHKTEALKRAAVVNIKKTPGKETSEYDEILRYLKKDFSFIKTELEILEPKVVIVGGMKNKKRLSKTIREGFGLKKLEDHIYRSNNGTIFLETHHPSYPKIQWDEWIDFFKYAGKKYLTHA
jgi:uracil-DNA glycosylase